MTLPACCVPLARSTASCATAPTAVRSIAPNPKRSCCKREGERRVMRSGRGGQKIFAPASERNQFSDLSMVNLIRRFQKPLLMLVAAVTIVSFVIFFNIPGARGGGFRSEKIGTISGRDFTRAQEEQASRRFEVCFALQMADLLF